MNKKLLTPLFLLTGFFLFGQGIRDTIEVARNFKTALFFGENITDSFMGNEDVFSMDTPKNTGSSYNYQMLKLSYEVLAVEKKNHTNLTVITQSGNVFEFILKLTKVPSKLNWTITPDKALFNIKKGSLIGIENKKSKENIPLITNNDNENSTVIDFSEVKKLPRDSLVNLATPDLYKNHTKEYYRLRCYYMQFNKARIPRFFARNDGVYLWLNGVYYNNNELYVHLRLENKEEIDLDINFLKYFIVSSYKNTTKQKIPITDKNGLVYLYKVPKTVKGNTENHFVIVFKKMTLDNKKKLLIELDEESGNRNLSLRIGKDIINKPISF